MDTAPYNGFLNTPLQQDDPEVFAIIKDEERRQFSGLELIASENFTSQAVIEALGSCLTNKYSEGLPGARYYGGTENVDKLERLAQARALRAFNLSPEQWACNVQPYSGSSANMAVYYGILAPGDRLMGLDLPSGGHLTHGFQTPTRKVSATSAFFSSVPYRVDPATGLIDYDHLETVALSFRPKLLICGASAYPRDFDYPRLRAIADSVGALLLCDMAHISGLVSARILADPFQWCDVVTTTTHKTLRGPRAGIIFFRRDRHNLEQRINQAVFPGLQGGPHNHTIAATAVALGHLARPEFAQYAQAVVTNAQALARCLADAGHTIVTGGTDNHIVLWDLRPVGLTGSKYERLCDEIHISVNKNAIHGDKSALSPGGVRLGTPALTSRSFGPEHMVQVAGLLDRALALALAIQTAVAPATRLADFGAYIDALKAEPAAAENGTEADAEAASRQAALRADFLALRAAVHDLSVQFPMPGFATEDL
ncbi:serine hydroxymethyltransferase [Fonticula alba]|uniref:Serine hydroxymethyltransferase n=1 Tax=Fonticula alba TaxID=691883 RepID=A0A058Z858_FONAL|nr:serine hydroxymethyltransferase [Fonticula alba]KCV70306.1 serine hydroxymethyltransferase [Fonticula alba]|eukprot:XP_009494822.1 serine hydroxymethyltransferase [Fonticula alba]